MAPLFMERKKTIDRTHIHKLPFEGFYKILLVLEFKDVVS